jgi:excisionase family DNA binding protein
VHRSHSEHTVQPPPDTGALPAVAALRPDGGSCTLVGPDDTVLPLPAELVEVLAVAAAGLASGYAVTLTRHEQTVTTQEAADLLGISRPTLVRLLDHGVLPYDQPGSHRRLLLRDVLAFQRDQHHDLPAPGPAISDPG